MTRLPCQFCSKTFANPTNVRIHEKTHETNEKLVKCPVCSKTFQQKDLRYHLPTHNTFYCDHCPKVYQYKAGIKNHIWMHKKQKRFNCETCSRGFDHMRLLRFHLLTHVDSHPFKCDKCLRGFRSKHSIKNHFTLIHFEGLRKTYNCKVCGKNVTSKYHLKGHKLLHDKEPRKLKCIHCGKNYLSGFLENHIKHYHRRLIPGFNCKFCNKNFKSENIMKKHEQLHIIGKHNCDKCPKTFGSKFSLGNHKRKDHPENLPRVKCKICSKEVHVLHLKFHLKRHEKTVQMFCDFCPKVFDRKCAIAHHIKKCIGRKSKAMHVRERSMKSLNIVSLVVSR